MITITTIKASLNERIHEVVGMLLPGGTKKGNEWCTGDVGGGKGMSCKVCISGTKVGVWSDFATGDGGDLIDLWRTVKGQSTVEALADIKHFLNIKEPDFCHAPKKFTRPKPSQNSKEISEPSPVMKYLTEERKIPLEVLKKYEVSEASEIGPHPNWKIQKPWEGPWILFPYKRGGELLNTKYLRLKRKEGKKVTLVEPDAEPCLFGWQAIPESAREVVICEGEIDALSWQTYGFAALSVPFGGGSGAKQEWITHEWENLTRFETIYLSFDNDDAGNEGLKAVIERLDRARCRVIKLPKKDINECLMAGIPKSEIVETIMDAGSLDPEVLKRADFYTELVWKRINSEIDERPGISLPWHKTKKVVRFHPGEVSVWAGINGHGKSQLLGYVMLKATEQGANICIASLEMKPERTLERMMLQSIGNDKPTRADFDFSSEFMQKVWLFDLVGTAKTERLIETFRYAYHRYGVTHFVVDSLMKCGMATDNYNAQKQFVEMMCDFATETSTHVHIVHHIRKGDNEEAIPGKFDIRGAGEISDLASNVFIVWRNKKKEQSELPAMSEPDAVLRCDKNREIGWEGKILLWYDKGSGKYYDQGGDML